MHISLYRNTSQFLLSSGPLPLPGPDDVLRGRVLLAVHLARDAAQPASGTVGYGGGEYERIEDWLGYGRNGQME